MTVTRPPRRRPSRLLLGALALALTVGAACTGRDQTPRSTRTGSPAATATPPSRPTGSAAVPTIRTTELVYGRNDTIVVEIRNATPTDWYATSGRTWCTIFEAQRRLDGGNRTEGSCTEGAPPGSVKIPAGAQQRLELIPGGSNAPLPAGRYRLSLAASEGSASGAPVTITSPEFTIEE